VELVRRGLICVLAALALTQPAAAGGPSLRLGAAEDLVKQLEPYRLGDVVVHAGGLDLPERAIGGLVLFARGQPDRTDHERYTG